jgi:hypothetical protein
VQLGYSSIERGDPGTADAGELGEICIVDLAVTSLHHDALMHRLQRTTLAMVTHVPGRHHLPTRRAD